MATTGILYFQNIFKNDIYTNKNDVETHFALALPAD